MGVTFNPFIGNFEMTQPGPQGPQGPQGPPGQNGSASAKVDELTLTATNITNGTVTLSGTPSAPSAVVCFPDGGPAQKYGVDFTVTGTTLSWSGLGLASSLSAGDILIVSYLT